MFISQLFPYFSSTVSRKWPPSSPSTHTPPSQISHARHFTLRNQPHHKHTSLDCFHPISQASEEMLPSPKYTALLRASFMAIALLLSFSGSDENRFDHLRLVTRFKRMTPSESSHLRAGPDEKYKGLSNFGALLMVAGVYELAGCKEFFFNK